MYFHNILCSAYTSIVANLGATALTSGCCCQALQTTLTLRFLRDNDWGVGRQELAAEDSTRALAKGSPLMPTPPRSANSEQSRQAVLLEAPLDIEYDVEVDCKI